MKNMNGGPKMGKEMEPSAAMALLYMLNMFSSRASNVCKIFMILHT